MHAVLTRHGLHRLAWLDRPTGQVIRRYELVDVDVKKIGRCATTLCAGAGKSTVVVGHGGIAGSDAVLGYHFVWRGRTNRR